MDKEKIISQTKKWIFDVVIGLNFCPFAAKEFKNETIQYDISLAKDMKTALKDVEASLKKLEKNQEIATSFLIFPQSFASFATYLRLVYEVERFLKQKKYVGTFQIASFHPNYLFQNMDENEPSNYTNRSPYAMLHFLREESLAKAVIAYKNPEKIPENNILLAQKLGLEKMKALKMGE